MVTGLACGVFDLFHVGHVNLLKRASGLCDRLIVGVSIDELVQYKGKSPVIPFAERVHVVESCRYVDVVIPQTDMDKISLVTKLNVDRLFVGDDWYGSEKWRLYEVELSVLGCDVVYLPYTHGTSSTLINKTLDNMRTS